MQWRIEAYVPAVDAKPGDIDVYDEMIYSHTIRVVDVAPINTLTIVLDRETAGYWISMDKWNDPTHALEYRREHFQYVDIKSMHTLKAEFGGLLPEYPGENVTIVFGILAEKVIALLNNRSPQLLGIA